MSDLIRYRRAIAALLGAVCAPLAVTTPPDLADFADAGGLILRGHLAEVYANAWNQAGPVQLLISRLLVAAGHPDGTPALPVIVLTGAAMVAGAMWLCRGSLRRELFAALLALLWVLAPLPWNGHPAELAIPVLWAYSVKLGRDRRELAAVAALALGVAIAPWAILGIPCLLAAAPWRRALPAGAVAAALGAASYLPFVLTGHFAMFRLKWGFSAGTLPSLLHLHDVTWGLRLAQGAIVAGGVALIALRCRRDPRAVALVPLAAGLLRVATDPIYYPYYWFPVAVSSVLLLAVDRRRPVLAGLIGYLAALAESGNWTVGGSLGCLALVVFLAVTGRTDVAGKSGETEATFPAVAATR